MPWLFVKRKGVRNFKKKTKAKEVLNYIDQMPWITQSSLVNASPEVFRDAIQSKPRLSSTVTKGVSLTYSVVGELRNGSTMEYNLIQGLFRISWSGIVQNFDANSGFDCVVKDSEPFEYFRSHHQLKEFGNKLLIRESLEFRSHVSGLEDALSGVQIEHALEFRGEASQETREMRSLGQNLA